LPPFELDALMPLSSRKRGGWFRLRGHVILIIFKEMGNRCAGGRLEPEPRFIVSRSQGTTRARTQT
jgi:hypothetical protein